MSFEQINAHDVTSARLDHDALAGSSRLIIQGLLNEGIDASAIPIPEVVVSALKKYLPDGELVESVLSDGEMLKPLYNSSGTSYPLLYKHPVPEELEIQGADIILIETDEAGQFTGIGDISYASGDLPPDTVNKPFVAYTETVEGARKQGLGTQRLRRMNALSRAHFDNPLYSDLDGFTEPEAHSVWIKLVANGEAEQYVLGGIPIYRFI